MNKNSAGGGETLWHSEERAQKWKVTEAQKSMLRLLKKKEVRLTRA